MKLNFFKLLVSIGLCLGVGLLGSVFTVSAIPTWYAALHKSVFSPPNWIFAPVWTTLYILMGVSLYLLWTSKSKKKQKAMKVFFLQLGLNAVWLVIFFGAHNPSAALVDIAALWIAIVLTINYFYPLSRPAAYLLIPYLLWVSFAGMLNVSIVLLNIPFR